MRRQDKNKKAERNAGVAELADAQASGACGRKIVWVQVPSPASFFIQKSYFSILDGSVPNYSPLFHITFIVETDAKRIFEQTMIRAGPAASS